MRTRASPPPPPQAQTILISMFCAIIVANVLFVAYYFVPWMRRILLESTRVAHLLAEVRRRRRERAREGGRG